MEQTEPEIHNIVPSINEKLQTIHSKLPSIYRDFTKTYVLSQMHPENTEYKNAFENIRFNLKKEEMDVTDIQMQIQKALDDINHKLIAYNAVLHKEKEKNRRLQAVKIPVNNTYEASQTRIDDYSTTYKTIYYYNIALIAGILMLFILIMRMSSFALGIPSFGTPLLLFILSFAMLMVYIYYFGTSGYLFILFLLLFVLFTVGIFIKSKT